MLDRVFFVTSFKKSNIITISEGFSMALVGALSSQVQQSAVPCTYFYLARNPIVNIHNALRQFTKSSYVE